MDDRREVWRPVRLYPIPMEGAECVLQLPDDLKPEEAEKIARFVRAVADKSPFAGVEQTA